MLALKRAKKIIWTSLLLFEGFHSFAQIDPEHRNLIEGFNAVRHGDEGAQSVSLLFQYDFEARKKNAEGTP